MDGILHGFLPTDFMAQGRNVAFVSSSILGVAFLFMPQSVACSRQLDVENQILMVRRKVKLSYSRSKKEVAIVKIMKRKVEQKMQIARYDVRTAAYRPM